MLDWRLLGEWLKLLRDEARILAATQRRRLQFALVVVVLARAWKPWLRRWLLRLHAWRFATPPQLVYQSTPVNDALLEHCPTLRSSYLPPWYLANGHAQTLYLGAQMRATHPVIRYEREIVELPDGGIVSLDWALPPRATDGTIPRLAEIDARHSTMVILPGLTGGSDEFYIRSLVHEIHARGWQCVVLNARGCARTPLRTPQLFSCAHTGDLRFVLEMFRDKYAFRTLVATGFSMGSNVLVKYLGEYREDALVTAAVSVGNPFDMVAASRNLQRSLLYRHTYYAALTENLKKLFFHRSNAHEAFRDYPLIDLEAVRNATGIDDFDEKLTCIVFGYKDADDYYADASSSARIQHVCVPLLCLNATDDPISAPHTIPFDAIRANANVILCLTKAGGHLGFYEQDDEDEEEDKEHHSSAKPTTHRGVPRIWSSRAIAEFADGVHTTTP